MNLVMASVLLLAMLAFQPTLIYGTKKGLATAISHNNNRKTEKKHSFLSSSSSSSSLPSFESADVLTRSARGASDTAAAAPAAPAAVGTTETNAAGGHQKNGSGNKRTKNNNNNKKLNRNSTPESSVANAGRKHLDKMFSGAGLGATNNHQQQQQQQKREQQHHGNGNKGGKQRQLVKSQQHQNHSKRTGGKVKSESVEKSVDADKSQSTCRYAKSAWSECDAKTNMRSRTLTLKKGEANCLPTRTMQKKCKKTCRYEKGAWSECTNGLMTRQDKLKSTGSSNGSNPAAGDSNSCEALRSINKKCNPGGGAAKQPGGKANKERKNKDKASRRTPAPQQA